MIPPEKSSEFAAHSARREASRARPPAAPLLPEILQRLQVAPGEVGSDRVAIASGKEYLMEHAAYLTGRLHRMLCGMAAFEMLLQQGTVAPQAYADALSELERLRLELEREIGHG